jgi:hypothetical protein
MAGGSGSQTADRLVSPFTSTGHLPPDVPMVTALPHQPHYDVQQSLGEHNAALAMDYRRRGRLVGHGRRRGTGKGRGSWAVFATCRLRPHQPELHEFYRRLPDLRARLRPEHILLVARHCVHPAGVALRSALARETIGTKRSTVAMLVSVMDGTGPASSARASSRLEANATTLSKATRARLCRIELGPPKTERHPTCARLARSYAAALSRLCDVLASLPVTSSNRPDPWVRVGALAFYGVSKPNAPDDVGLARLGGCRTT